MLDVSHSTKKPEVEREYSVKCQLSDHVVLRRVPRRTIIATTSNLQQMAGLQVQKVTCRYA